MSNRSAKTENFVNPLELPSLLLSQYRVLPPCPGVYFVISETDEILYIGRSLNLSRRWPTHHLLKKLKEIGNVRIAWMEINDLGLFAEIESALINYFAPRLNIANKWVGGKKTINFSKQELEALEKTVELTGRSETDIIREALREKTLELLKVQSQVS